MFKIVTIETGGKVLTPKDLKDILNKLPKIQGEGVVLSGRLPIWVYGAAIHYYHPTTFVACYDPRLNGGVVVQSHTPDVEVGTIIGISEDDPVITVEV